MRGRRAVVDFIPSLSSSERLCAGVVLLLDNGEVSWRNALDMRKAESAFGAAGLALHSVAERLCESLAHHWLQQQPEEAWAPPFEGAAISESATFTARDVDAAFEFALRQSSSLHVLLGAYEIPQQTRTTGIVERVRQAVRRSSHSKYLAPRFGRELNIGADTQPLKVDFLGQHFACYFLQVTASERGIPGNAERAYGKLFELQALRRFVSHKRKSLGLLDDERPGKFELVLVGDGQHPVQRRALAQIEALADKGEVRARPLLDANAAAEHVLQMERQVA